MCSPGLHLHASKTRDGQGSSAEGQDQSPTHHPCHAIWDLSCSSPQPPESSAARSLSLISTLLLPGCHVRDAVYTLHQQAAATCGQGRDARLAGTWVQQETRDGWAWAPSSSSSQRLGWEPVGRPHPTPDIGRSHSFPIHSTHTCSCQLILNPLEGMCPCTHTHTHTPVLEEGIETYGSSRPTLPGSQGQGPGRLCLLVSAQQSHFLTLTPVPAHLPVL